MSLILKLKSWLHKFFCQKEIFFKENLIHLKCENTANLHLGKIRSRHIWQLHKTYDRFSSPFLWEVKIDAAKNLVHTVIISYLMYLQRFLLHQSLEILVSTSKHSNLDHQECDEKMFSKNLCNEIEKIIHFYMRHHYLHA